MLTRQRTKHKNKSNAFIRRNAAHLLVDISGTGLAIFDLLKSQGITVTAVRRSALQPIQIWEEVKQ